MLQRALEGGECRNKAEEETGVQPQGPGPLTRDPELTEGPPGALRAPRRNLLGAAFPDAVSNVMGALDRVRPVAEPLSQKGPLSGLLIGCRGLS